MNISQLNEVNEIVNSLKSISRQIKKLDEYLNNFQINNHDVLVLSHDLNVTKYICDLTDCGVTYDVVKSIRNTLTTKYHALIDKLECLGVYYDHKKEF